MKQLRGLNMTVPVGSIYGFIGENGSGKSTTEKIICGPIRPDGGSVKPAFYKKKSSTQGVRKYSIYFDKKYVYQRACFSC